MKTLLKKDIDWLWKAANDKVKECIFSVLDDCAISTDGYRAHIINRDLLPDEINRATVKKSLEIFDNGNIVTRIIINPKFLYEALSGFLDQSQIEIVLVRNEDLRGIEIVANHSNNQAFVMCMKKEEGNER